MRHKAIIDLTRSRFFLMFYFFQLSRPLSYILIPPRFFNLHLAYGRFKYTVLRRLGAIYVLSKVFGKKKKQSIPTEADEHEELGTPSPPIKKTPTFEDILKELTGGNVPEPTTEGKAQPLGPDKPEPPVLATDPVGYQKKDKKAMATEELINIVPQKSAEVKKPKFQRDGHFAIEEEDAEIADSIAEMLSDYDGVRRAVVIKEVLDRKY